SPPPPYSRYPMD
nr:Chain B, Smad7 derived peptide [Homo sapiens]